MERGAWSVWWQSAGVRQAGSKYYYLPEAAKRRIDILAFPEMSLTGYTDPTRYPEAVLTLDGREVRHFLQVTRSFPGTVLAGLIEANPAGKPYRYWPCRKRARV